MTLACGGRAIDGAGGEEGTAGGGRGGGAGVDPGASASDPDVNPLGPSRPGSGMGRAGAGGLNGTPGGEPPGSEPPSGSGGSNTGPALATSDQDCFPDPISLATTVEVLANAAAAEAPADRPFIRYVSAGAHRTTCSPAVTRAAARARIAVDKLVNSLSIEAVPTPTRPLDAEALLLRLDLRDYGWARPIAVNGVTYPDGWDAIVAHSPMALEFAGGDADVLKQRVGVPIPWLLAGSVVAAASTGELYYALTAASATLAELKASLGITPPEDLPGGSWQRAGFSNSGVSPQDRGVARYAGTALGAGIFWQTFDYAPTTDSSSLFLEPLGAHGDAAEALYSLPNGLPAYFAADAAGRRVTEAMFVVDPARAGASRVMASCGSCHNTGVIAVEDAVRPFVEANVAGTFTPGQVQAVRDAYPMPSVMQAMMDDDSARLQAALVQAGQAADSPDPINRVALDYALVVDHDVVARELYVRPDAFELDQLPPSLATAVTANGLSRATLEASYRDALCVLHDGPVVPVGCP